MPRGYFFRIYNETSLNDLKAKKTIQKAKNCKQMEYEELVSLYLSANDFECVCSNLLNAAEYCIEYSNQSTAGLNGKWRCIILENTITGEQLIIYTGGRSFPLYAAYKESSK